MNVFRSMWTNLYDHSKYYRTPGSYPSEHQLPYGPDQSFPPPNTEPARQSQSQPQPQPQRTYQEYPVIAIMGPTGSGKSTLISKLAVDPRDVHIGHGLNSCTETVDEVRCQVNGRKVALVDTPGFNDTNLNGHRSDADILAALARWMQASYDEYMFLSGIIYLHPINEPRMTGAGVRNLHMFRKLCGDNNLSKVILATSKWEITPPADAISREKELMDLNGHWGAYLGAGARARRCLNNTESLTMLISELIGYGNTDTRFMPRIQQEVVSGTRLIDTEAGAFLNSQLMELKQQHEEEKAALREEWERAKREQNNQMQNTFQAERKKLDEKIAKRVEEERAMNATRVEQLEHRIQELEAQRQRTGRLPTNVRRGWHHYWRCLGCQVKTVYAGEWECTKCGVVQVNDPK